MARFRSIGRYSSEDVCSVDECTSPPQSRGWCSMHYNRWRDHGDPLGGNPVFKRPHGSPAPKCLVEACDEPARSRGYCVLHWSRVKRHGSADAIPPTDEERFWAKVDKSEFISPTRGDLGPCWLWTGATVRGYGVFWANGKNVIAHRFAYTLEYGSIPDGLTLDHLCYTRNCVRHSHLEPVTSGENVQRSRGKIHYVVLT